jgi:hypothetical protein
MKMNRFQAPKKQTQSNPIKPCPACPLPNRLLPLFGVGSAVEWANFKNFHAQTQDSFKNPVHKIFELTFGIAAICCGQDYEKTPKFENKKVDNYPGW